MKRLQLILVAFAFIFCNSSCLKEGYQTFTCNATLPQVSVPAGELQAVEAYLAQQGIKDAVKYQNAFYYKIETPGTGNRPTLCSNIVIYFQGKLIDGTTFDQTGNTSMTYAFANVITGWKLGISLIKAGGKIKLYLPPTLGYGNSFSGNIPANSILVYEISLVAA